MAKNSKTKRMVKEGADRAVQNMDQHDLTSMTNMSNQQRKQQQQENLSGGE